MSKLPRSVWRRWLTWIMSAVLVVSLAAWFFTRDTLPEPITVGTAVPGGLYHELGENLDELLRDETGHTVRLLETDGSQDNCDRLRRGEIDLAIVQAGSVSLQDLAVVAPLHHDIVVLLVKRDLLESGSVRSVSDLADRRVLLGLPQSGMRRSGHDVLAHYGIAERVIAEEKHFTELLGDQEGRYDAAIVTTGLEAPNLRQVLATGRYRLLPLDARAIERRFGHFRYADIPPNLWPPLPESSVQTVHTLALLVVREDASSKLVTAVLNCLHEHDFRHRFPSTSPSMDGTEFAFIRMHPTAVRYNDPLHGFGWLASSLEAIAAGRELLVALAAGIFLVWERWRRVQEKERRARVEAQKRRLNEFLERTLQIEKSQMDVTGIRELEVFLDEVTNLKLEALDELSHEELQDHRAFSIFLMQCANLISKIQLKIIFYSAHPEQAES